MVYPTYGPICSLEIVIPSRAIKSDTFSLRPPNLSQPKNSPTQLVTLSPCHIDIASSNPLGLLHLRHLWNKDGDKPIMAFCFLQPRSITPGGSDTSPHITAYCVEIGRQHHDRSRSLHIPGEITDCAVSVDLKYEEVAAARCIL